MDEIRCTLISDGSSDRALLPILSWVLRKKGEVRRIQAEWADLRRLPNPPRDLHDRILNAIDLFPCDLLFVHRDAEKQEPERRYAEIRYAIQKAASLGFQTPAVCVVPVQMTEAWLLFDENAIRLAAGNPNSRSPLNLPDLFTIEQNPDPKSILFEILREASGLSGRRLKKFNVAESRIRIAELISDYTPLENLSAFRRLEYDIENLSQNDWVFNFEREE